MNRRKFDFRFINKDDIYVGNIVIVKNVDKEVLKQIKKCDVVLGDFSGACKYEVAKENAILIKVSNNCFVDIDSIKHLSDCDYINDMLEQKVKNTNILMTYGTFNPYVGQLYVVKLRNFQNLNKKRTDIIELKLLNAQK